MRHPPAGTSIARAGRAGRRPSAEQVGRRERIARERLERAPAMPRQPPATSAAATRGRLSRTRNTCASAAASLPGTALHHARRSGATRSTASSAISNVTRPNDRAGPARRRAPSPSPRGARASRTSSYGEIPIGNAGRLRRAVDLVGPWPARTSARPSADAKASASRRRTPRAAAPDRGIASGVPCATRRPARISTISSLYAAAWFRSCSTHDRQPARAVQRAQRIARMSSW